MKPGPGRDLTRGRARRTRSTGRPGTGHPASAMSKGRTVLLRTTSFSVKAGEAAVGARPATVASDEQERSRPPRANCRNARVARVRTAFQMGLPEAPSAGAIGRTVIAVRLRSRPPRTEGRDDPTTQT